MSELPANMIAQVRTGIEDERVRDLTLVVRRTLQAEREGQPLDARFEAELAEARREQAFDFYDYPVQGSGPTLESSLEIVNDIATIRELVDAQTSRLGILAAQGTGAALAAARRREYHDRVKEKDLLDEPELMGLWVPVDK